MPKAADWITLIEACYNLEGNEQQWLTRLFECTKPLIGRGDKQFGWSFDCTPTTFVLRDFTQDTPKFFEWVARMGHKLASPGWIDLIYRSGNAIGTDSQVIQPHYPNIYKLFVSLHGGKFRDSFAIGGFTGTGRGLIINTLLPEISSPTPIEYKRWTQMSAHMGAGLRLYQVARQLPLDFDATAVEAIFDASGKEYESKSLATEKSARQRLREAVRHIEKMRSQTGRTEIDETLDAWKGLVEGRWSLVDRFDTDGKRFVIAVKNDPGHRDLRGLSLRERQVAEYLGLGRSAKEISYILGVTASAVTNCISDAQLKLGLASSDELAVFFAPSGLRAKLAEMCVAGEQLLVGAYPLINEHAIKPLTVAERDILASLLAGATYIDIAGRRSVSFHTVASQAQTIYRKLGVRSRIELAGQLYGK